MPNRDDDIIREGDQVVCVKASLSICPVHTEELLGPDPNPQMVGKIYTVTTLHSPFREGCLGLISLKGQENPNIAYCIGCFRKLKKSTIDDFMSKLHPHNRELVKS